MITPQNNSRPEAFSGFFKEKVLGGFDLSQEDFSFPSEKVWIIQKWGWDYQKAHDFQWKATQFVKENKSITIFIFCTHPHCFTLGRGLQKHKIPKDLELIDFDPHLKRRLPFPLYEIKRGGGLTFHYPGQWVFYPIVNLMSAKTDVYKIMNWVLEKSKKSIEKVFGIQNLSHEKELLGLWYENQKLASIGIAVTRFVTYHGMALNINCDPKVVEALSLVNPCGLPGKTYTYLESLVKETSSHHDLVEGVSPLEENSLFWRFHNSFLEDLQSMVSSEQPFF
ncbi:MAG: lipoyl(octanoyl) transferase LipB [Bdellovibrionota bacterium]|nr:lipoyl(octanoyl) transferase LipB [Bdellovibrionota bacterium]